MQFLDIDINFGTRLWLSGLQCPSFFRIINLVPVVALIRMRFYDINEGILRSMHNCYGKGITDMMGREKCCLDAGVCSFLPGGVVVEPYYPA